MTYDARILVTGAGGGVGQSIIKALKIANQKLNRDYRIQTADMDPLSVGLYCGEKGHLVPSAESDNFVDRLIEISLENNIDVIMPGSDPELPVLARRKQKIIDEGILPVIGDPEPVKMAMDKWKTYEFLKRNGLNYPRSWTPDQITQIKKNHFPLIVKPRKGSGSVGLHEAKNKSELDFYLSRVNNPLIQEKVSTNQQEYTCGVLLSQTGKFLDSIALKRTLKKGSSYKAVVDDFPDVRKGAEEVALKSGLVGPVNVQMRLTEEGPVTLEINPRFSGTTATRAQANFNGPDAIIRNFLYDESIDEMDPDQLIMLRYLNEFYVSKEDLETLEAENSITKSDDPTT